MRRLKSLSLTSNIKIILLHVIAISSIATSLGKKVRVKWERSKVLWRLIKGGAIKVNLVSESAVLSNFGTRVNLVLNSSQVSILVVKLSVENLTTQYCTV